MAIEVLLMAEVEGLGHEGDVVKVADGHARNYLYPRKMAAPVTDAMRRRLAKMQATREIRRKEELEAAKELAAKVEKLSCTIQAKSGEEGKLFGSVTAADIIANLKGQGVAVDKNVIQLETPIKELGVFNVKVRLHPEVEGTLRVWVVEE